MIIRNESVITTALIEYEDSVYERCETPDAIYWNHCDCGLFEFSKSSSKWQNRIKCHWRECQEPDLEIEYQKLKACVREQ